MLFLTSNEVETLCNELDIVAIITEALSLHSSGKVLLPPEAYMSWDAPNGGRARSLNMPAYVGGNIDAVGTKIINGNPRNILRNLPRASGVTLLFDRDTGRVCSIMDASFISARRTSVVSLIAAKALHQRATPVRLAVFGAGVLAQNHIEVFASNLKIKTIKIYDLELSRAESLFQRLHHLDSIKGIEIKISDSIVDVLRDSTCILTTTTTVNPYLHFDMLSKGSLLLNVSLDDFAEDVFLNADRIYVDDIDLIEQDSNRILGKLIRSGKVARSSVNNTSGRSIAGTIGQLVSGKISGRVGEDEIIMVNAFGMAIEDIAIASSVYASACTKNVGQALVVDDYDHTYDLHNKGMREKSVI